MEAGFWDGENVGVIVERWMAQAAKPNRVPFGRVCPVERVIEAVVTRFTLAKSQSQFRTLCFVLKECVRN